MDRSRYKIVLLGESGVGKSSLLYRLRKGESCKDICSTIGMAFSTEEMVVDSHSVTLEIWDSAGQERFNAIIPMYFKNAHGIICCYDSHDPRTKRDLLKKWLVYIQQFFPEDDLPFLFLVGTKYDLTKPEEEGYVHQDLEHAIRESKKIMGVKEGDDQEKKFSGYLTSSITGKNIQFLFDDIASKLYKNINIIPEPRNIHQSKVILEENNIIHPKNCCNGM